MLHQLGYDQGSMRACGDTSFSYACVIENCFITEGMEIGLALKEYSILGWVEKVVMSIVRGRILSQLHQNIGQICVTTPH